MQPLLAKWFPSSQIPFLAKWGDSNRRWVRKMWEGGKQWLTMHGISLSQKPMKSISKASWHNFRSTRNKNYINSLQWLLQQASAAVNNRE